MASIAESLYLSLEIMAMGMLLVFIFLSLLILGIKITERLCNSDVDSLTLEKQISMPKEASHLDLKKVAAITAAIHQFRSKH